MCSNSKIRNRGRRLIGYLWIVLLFTGGAAAQPVTADQMKEILAAGVPLDPEDARSIADGKIVAKLLPAKARGEVSVFGIVRVNAPLKDISKGFGKTMSRQKNKTALRWGDLSYPPEADDFRRITLSGGEIEDLKKCVIGRCKLKLSASMIERFEAEIDWTSTSHKKEAAALYRRALFEYVTEYLRKGDGGLIRYHDQRTPVDLSLEIPPIYDRFFWIRESAPKFHQYLKKFPNHELPNVKNAINWSTVKIGLKPVILFTHVITYDGRQTDFSQILIVSKQIYSNHYFDTSIGFTALATFPAADGKFDSYVIYMNHSRSGSLGGGFGKFIRKIVEDEALDKLEQLLTETKENAEIHVPNEREALAAEKNVPNGGIAQYYVSLTVLGVAVLILIIWLAFRRSNR